MRTDLIKRNPSGICACGCGGKTLLATRTTEGYRRGEPRLYIRGHNSRQAGPKYNVENRGHTTPCWIWNGSLSARGYGWVWKDGGPKGAHRVSYEEAYGSIQKDYDVHHLCRQPACVRPSHLKALSRREHMVEDGLCAFGNPNAKVKKVAP